MKYMKGAESKYTAAKFALITLGIILGGGSAFAQTDPGPRGGTPGAGAPIANLSSDQARFFATALAQFTEVEGVVLPSPGNGGLGPTFNGNACAMCHSQPAIGGTSPSVNPSDYPKSSSRTCSTS